MATDALLFFQLILQGPGHPLHDRVDRLQVGRVGGEHHVDGAARSPGELAPESLVVLDVAGALDGPGIDVALELLEQLSVALARRC